MNLNVVMVVFVTLFLSEFGSIDVSELRQTKWVRPTLSATKYTVAQRNFMTYDDTRSRDYWERVH